MAQWKQAGLATQRKVVQVELGASLFVGGNVRLGYVRLGGRGWVCAASFFFHHSFLTLKKMDLCVSY